MALTPTIRATQVAVTLVGGGGAMEVSMLTALTVANFPTPEMKAGQAQVTIVTDRVAPQMRVSQTLVLAVARGRVYNPKLRAWTYTLDGHDFYVLRLGDSKTLVFDLLTGHWAWFSSGNHDYWRPLIGMNWYSAGVLPAAYGSNVVVGDDTFGHLWLLNPEQGFDYDAADTEERVAFPRVATGQLITRERDFAPIYEVYLNAAAGDPSVVDDTVEHLYSDDAGTTYVSAGSIVAVSGDFMQEFAWRSLGLAYPAGRLFRIRDYGALARIDSLDVNFGEEDAG